MHTQWNVEVVADSDSRWKWGATVAGRLADDRPIRTHGTLLLGRSVPNAQQLKDVGVEADTLRRASIATTVARLTDTDAQVVVLACIGGGVQSLLHALSRAWAERAVRPVVLTGYVGLVYEKVVDGLLSRAGADIVLANSAEDADRFRATYAGIGIEPDFVVRTALPFLDGRPHDPHAAGRDRPFTVTFVTQPGVPATKAERSHAVLQALEHAVRHPDRRVIVKLRGRVGERTTHVEPYNYASLLSARQRPANLQFVHGPMGPVLDRTDLCLTVSSTAAIEAMHRRIPTGILTDFGVREALGNQLFLGSGAFVSWAAVHAGAVPATDPLWALRNGVHDADPYAELQRRMADLVDRRAALPPLRPWLNSTDAPAYLPGLLGRYGLDPTGVPLASGTGDGSDTTLPSRAVRAAARRAYGVGVRVLEPRIKRLAQI